MSTEENKALVRRFVDEVQSRGNIDALDEICSPEFVNHSAPPGVPSNCEGVKQLTAMFRQAFPDSYFTIEDMMAEGDNPPVGILLCSDKDGTEVEFATAGMDTQMFVSRYLVALPSAEQLRKFVEADRARIERKSND